MDQSCAGIARGQGNVARSLDVDLALFLQPAPTDMDACGRVNDATCPLTSTPHRFGITDVAYRSFDVETIKRSGIGAISAEHAYGLTPVEKQTNNVVAHEPRGARNER
jgi:hypothetical protein